MLQRRLWILGLTLAVTACGGSDGVVGVDEGRVRFVLSSSNDASLGAGDGPAATAARPGTDLDGNVVTDPLHGEDDGPRRFFESAGVTFSSILARNVAGVLVDVDMDLPVTVDILSMEGAREIQLPEGDLPPATYDQLVVVMTQVRAVTHDGTTITLDPAGGGWTAIVEVCPFTIDDGGTTTVALRFMLRNAFRWRENRFHFSPRFVCESGD